MAVKANGELQNIVEIIRKQFPEADMKNTGIGSTIFAVKPGDGSARNLPLTFCREARLTVDEYVIGVVMGCMDGRSEEEALKAQIIIARTNTYREMDGNCFFYFYMCVFWLYACLWHHVGAATPQICTGLHMYAVAMHPHMVIIINIYG